MELKVKLQKESHKQKTMAALGLLSGCVERVSQFKQWQKLKPELEAAFGHWQRSPGKRFHVWLSQDSWNIRHRIEIRENGSDYSFSFTIEEKTIPALAQALEEEISRVKGWEDLEGPNSDYYTRRIEKIIEESISGEMTTEQLAMRVVEWQQALKQAADSLRVAIENVVTPKK